MGINTNIEKKDGYIHFKIEGEYPGLQILNGIDQILEAANKYQINNILLDIRNLEYSLSSIDSFNIGEYIAKTYSDKLIKIACLRDKYKEDDFTEIVAINRGANFHLFNDENNAINWLKD